MPANKKPSGKTEVLMFLLGNPLRKQLLRLYLQADGMRSPKELTVPTNSAISNVGYHVRILAEYKAIELVDTQPRRGSVEHFYEVTDLVDEVPWARSVLGL
ncbi:MAG TPA: hypothetical protein VKB23_11840 [Solirubrobacterales bacterium]|nr:hypothetical protein [Solirubrobacterales bacterium]